MKKWVKRVLAVVTVAALGGIMLAGCTDFDGEVKNVPEKYVSLWSENLEFKAENWPSVVKPMGRDLKVMQVTDVHYDFNNDKKEETLRMIAALIKRNAPDVIAMTGDWTSDQEHTEEYAHAVFRTLEESGVPWAPVFGNHDREGTLSSYDYADIFAGYPNCLFRAGFSNVKGVGNYVVTVREGTRDGKIVSALTMFDSHTSVARGVEKYQPLGKNQIALYHWEINGLNKIYQAQGSGDTMPTMAFLHIPLKEYAAAYKEARSTSKHLIGSNQEKVYPPEKNAGLFVAMTKTGSTKAVFAGHDHGNISACLYKGVVLSYGVQTGWCKGYRTEQQKGANIISLTESGEVRITHDYYPMAW